MDRTQHTAAIIAAKLGIKYIHVDSRLRPLNVGDFTGEDKQHSDIDSYLKNPDIKFPNGESLDDFRDRQKDFSTELFDWIKEHPKEKAILSGHLSNIIYWNDLGKSIKGYLDNYSTDEEDMVRPGGVVAVMSEGHLVPLLGENKKASISDKGDE